MKTVLIAWEMGSGLGHVMRASAFARAFVQRGCRVVVCLAELAATALVPWPGDVLLLQAPRPGRSVVTGNPAAYADILYACGYHDGNQLAALMTSWSHLIELVEPDLILADHAPTAQLAARINEIAQARIGSGFFAPPQITPLPAFRNWGKELADSARIARTEATVLATINALLGAAGIEPALSLAGALRPDLELIASWPELDPYAALRGAGQMTYIGNERVTGGQKPAAWPASSQKRIAAYLKGYYNPLDAVLQGMAAAGQTQIYIAGADTDLAGRKIAGSPGIATAPIDLRQLASECDVFVCHAGAGAAPVFLEAGKPVLLLPYQAEQRVNADLIVATGAGLRVDQETASQAFGPALARLLNEPPFTEAARELSTRWDTRTDPVITAVTSALALL